MKRKIRLRTIALEFLKIGCVAFGGWPTTARLLEEEFVDRRKLLKISDIQAATSYAQLIPGGTQTSIVSGVGHKLGGSWGSAVGTFFYLLPSMTIIFAFSVVYFKYLHNADLGAYFGPVRAGLVGIILANAYRIGKRHTTHNTLWLLVGLSLFAKLVIGINAAIIILCFASVGVGVSVVKDRRQRG